MLAKVAKAVKVCGALSPTVSTTIFPQLVMKVKVFGKTLAIVFGWAIDGDTCGLELALVHFFTGSLVAAETVDISEAAKAIAVAITKVRFIMAKNTDCSGYSHSIVAGGLLVISRVTRFTSRTSLVIRVEILARTS